MKVKFILPGVLVILIVCSLLYPVTKQASVIIHTPLMEVYNQLNNAANWRKWNQDVKRSGEVKEQQLKDDKGFTILTRSETINVRFSDAFVFSVQKESEKYDMILAPLKYDRATKVVVSFRTDLLHELIFGGFDYWLNRTCVNDLKKYLESPVSFYDVDFKATQSKGMDMMVDKAVVDTADEFKEIAKSLVKFRNTISPGLRINTDKIYLQITPSGQEVTMLIGAAVKKKIPSAGGLTYLHILAGKNLVVNYSGRYNGRERVYTGVGLYLQDHAMKNVMPPIEEYTVEGLPSASTSYVNTRIIFSVY